jgi:hypothetical protein
VAYLAVNLTTAVSWVTERIGALSTAATRGWALLVLGLLLCLLVTTYSLQDSEGLAKITVIATVDRLISAKPPHPPSPARTQAVAELRIEVQDFSRSHAGTYGMIVFDPYSGQTTSLNADRRFVAASLSKLYDVLTLCKMVSQG